MGGTAKARVETLAKRADPLIWLLVGDKLGDNAQVRALAEALGRPCEERRLVMREEWRDGKPPFAASLHHVDVDASASLEPPWPDLVITIGRRPAMAAMWLRERPGFTGKIVLVGRPKKWLHRFDVVVSPPQFRMPGLDNVLRLELPLIRADRLAVEAAGEAWRERFADLPRPVTALLVGGRTHPFVLDANAARELAARMRGIVKRDGGCVWATTSRRTPAEVVDALAESLPAGSRLHRWTAGGGDNPYAGLLALADRFVVTGDSISMMMEVASLGRPLAIHELPRERGPLVALRERCAALIHAGGALAPVGNLLYACGVARYSRDLGAVHRRLVAMGAAVRPGEPFREGVALPDESAAVAARIEELLEDGR